jgi:hypothetical protein
VAEGGNLRRTQRRNKKPRATNPGQKETLLNRQGEDRPNDRPDASPQRPWDAVTRRKLAFREFVGEKPANWTHHDDLTWCELKAGEFASKRLPPSAQERSIRGRFIAQFNAASTNEERKQILLSFIDQHFEVTRGWEWFDETCKTLEIAKRLLEEPAQRMALAAAAAKAAPAPASAAHTAKKEPTHGAPKPVDVISEREMRVFKVSQRVAGGRQYCHELDNAGIAPPRKGVWEDGPRKYLAAYGLGQPWRHRIEDEKYKIRRKATAAKLAGALAGE